MTLTRRKVLAILGGGTIVAAGAGAGAFVSTRTPLKAREPWNLAGTYNEPRRRALSWAILAPNPHNRQPWVVDLSQDNQIHLYVDTRKDLPETDPFDRQITIGLGCFLELLRMAAAEDGYRADIRPFPDGFDHATLDARPVAVIDMIKDPSIPRDPLFSYVPTRRSYKNSFDTTRDVPVDMLANLRAVAGPGVQAMASGETTLRAELRRLTHDAFALEMSIPHTYHETMNVLRIGKAEIEANPDGVFIGGPIRDSLALVGLISHEAARDMDHPGTQASIKKLLEPFSTQMAFTWLVTENDTRLDQLGVGRDWLRLNLTTTGLGLALCPVSQILQEYPEMAEMYQEAHRLLAPSGGRVQMLGQLGYATANIQPAPRWRVEAKILGG